MVPRLPVAVVAGVDGSMRRCEPWLPAARELLGGVLDRKVSAGGSVSPGVALADRQTLVMRGDVTLGEDGSGDGNYQLTVAAAAGCGWRPVGGDTVGPACRDSSYDAPAGGHRTTTHSETTGDVLPVTARRRALRACPTPGRVGGYPGFGRLADRSGKLRSRIDDALAGVEGRSLDRLPRKRRKPGTSSRGDGR